jgi:hypothetical protein
MGEGREMPFNVEEGKRGFQAARKVKPVPGIS